MKNDKSIIPIICLECLIAIVIGVTIGISSKPYASKIQNPKQINKIRTEKTVSIEHQHERFYHEKNQ